MSRRRFSYSGPIGRRTLSHSGRARSIGTTVFAALRPRERGRSTSPGISNLIGARSVTRSIHRDRGADSLEPIPYGGQEAGRGRPVDNAVIEADDDVHHLADRDRVLLGHDET